MVNKIVHTQLLLYASAIFVCVSYFDQFKDRCSTFSDFVETLCFLVAFIYGFGLVSKGRTGL